MKKLILFLILIPFFSFSQIKVEMENFTILYSEEKEQPLKVEYQVLCKNEDVSFSRSGMGFYKCDSIKTSDDADYYKNVWDKGHMAPAADFNCDEKALRSTFTYLNCALQHQELNRGTWKYLEDYERKLADTSIVKVKIDILFEENSKRLQTGAVVPEGFRKTIWLNDELFGIWYFPNKPAKERNVNIYRLK